MEATKFFQEYGYWRDREPRLREVSEAEVREKYESLLIDVLDAKEIMRAKGVTQAPFSEMFRKFSAEPVVAKAPVKGPSDDAIEHLAKQYDCHTAPGFKGFARALLARYQGAQPAAASEPPCGTCGGIGSVIVGIDGGSPKTKACPRCAAHVAAQPSVPLSMGLRSVAAELLACFGAWEPGVRVLGNVQAKDGADLMQAILATPSADEQGRRD
ncbi:hypothetical protein ACSBPU_13115 [Parapusillimonas sp. JC17]|uniref:hypothetical protein n=1 Tax=Parapusillimonas sp. JC17 TaxID=3445768 RepID=UPI003F9F9F90